MERLTMTSRTLRFYVLLASTLFAAPASGQSTYIWDNSNSIWESADSWTAGSGYPGLVSSDIADFNPQSVTTGTFFQPKVTIALSLQTITIANRYDLGNYSFTSNGITTDKLILSSNAVGSGLSLRGIGTTTFNGPSIEGFNTTQLATISIGSSTILKLTGTSMANTNVGPTSVLSGTLLIDNATTNTLTRFAIGANKLSLQGSGKFSLNANAAGGTIAVQSQVGSTFGLLSFQSGNSTVEINISSTPMGQTILVFGGYERFNPGATVNFVLNAPAGVTLGGSGANDPLIRFLQQTNLTNNAILKANTAGGGGGNATALAFVNGTDFAAWNTARQTVIALAATAVNSSTLSGQTTGNFSFTPNAGGTTTLTNNSKMTSLKLNITSATETTLNLGAFNLQTTGLLLPGLNSYSIIGTTGALFDGTSGTGIKNVYVTQALTVLSIGAVVPFSPTQFNFPIAKSGAGILELAGSVDQMNLSGQAIFLNEGVFRAALGVNLGVNNVIQFRGGVLEISNGATFSRSLGSVAAGSVNWDVGTGNGGGGGFSAINQNAIINIGSGASLIWADANFVQDGFALKFGAVASNRTVIWQNNLQLDSLAPGAYAVREINVTKGTGGSADLTQFVGVITGSSSTDLLKTGTGILVLANSTGNTYAGNTLVSAGTLQLSNTDSATSATGTGSIVVAQGAVLTGTGYAAPGASKNVIVLSGGIVAAGSPTGVLTISAPVVLKDGSVFRWNLDNIAPDPRVANSGLSNLMDKQSELIILGAGNTLTLGAITFQIREVSTPSFTNNETYSWLVASADSGVTLGVVTFDLTNASTFTAYGGASHLFLVAQGDGVYLNFTAAPEPSWIMMFAAVALMAGGLRNKWLRSQASEMKAPGLT